MGAGELFEEAVGDSEDAAAFDPGADLDGPDVVQGLGVGVVVLIKGKGGFLLLVRESGFVEVVEGDGGVPFDELLVPGEEHATGGDEEGAAGGVELEEGLEEDDGEAGLAGARGMGDDAAAATAVGSREVVEVDAAAYVSPKELEAFQLMGVQLFIFIFIFIRGGDEIKDCTSSTFSSSSSSSSFNLFKRRRNITTRGGGGG